MMDSSGTSPDYSSGMNGWLRRNKPSAPMSNEEIDHHMAIAASMAHEKAPLAQVKAYLDAAGVPQKNKKAEYAPGTDQYLGGLLMSALHGATFGWDDEGVGSLYGLVSGAGAQAGRDTYRRRLQAFHEQNPMTDLGMQLAGGLATGGAIAGVSKLAAGGARMMAPKAVEWLSEMGKVGKVLGASAAGGAVYAAGDTQGDALDRLKAMPGGAVQGAVLGGATVGASKVVGQFIRPFARNMPLLKHLYASVEEQADHQMLLDLAQDGKQVSAMLQRADDMHKQGLSPTIVDLAGENTKARMGAVQATPGEGMNAIKEGFKERQMGAGDRIMDWFKGKVRLSLQNIEQVRNGMMGARRLDGNLLYDDAMYFLDAQGVKQQTKVPLTDTLKKLFENKKFQDAWNAARIELRSHVDGTDIGPLTTFMPEHGAGPFYGPQTRKFALPNPAGTKAVVKKVVFPPKQGVSQAIYPPELSLAGLDYTKRWLDNVIRNGLADGQGGWSKGVAHNIADHLELALQEIDQSVPKYGVARKTYHSDSRTIGALDEGRKFFQPTNSADDISLAMQGHRSTAEVEAYKLGVIDNIRDRIYRQGGEAPNPTSFFASREVQRKLTAVFGQDAPDVLDRLKTEARFAQSYAKTLGSRTAEVMGAMADNESAAAGIAANLGAGRPGSAAVLLARAKGTEMKMAHGKLFVNALAERYIKGLNDPAELIGYLQDLEARRLHPSTREKVGAFFGAPRFGAALGGQANAQAYLPRRP